MVAVQLGAWIESTDIFYDVFIRPLHGTLGFMKSYQSVNVKFIEHPHCVGAPNELFCKKAVI